MENDGIIAARIEDKVSQALAGYYATSTGFLDAHEQTLARAHMRRPGVSGQARMLLYGGYEDADRRIMIAAPADFAESDEALISLDDWLAVARISYPKGSGQLTHRDYLGSLLGLGLNRSVIGDILVRDGGADVVIKPEISDFLLSEYRKAGRAKLGIDIVGIDDLIVPERHREEFTCAVSSLRLDNVVATGFGVGRSEASRAINRGLVLVDHEEVTKADRRVEEGQQLSLRGSGKIMLCEAAGTTRKGRTLIRMIRYL